jgi:hypothetical protein
LHKKEILLGGKKAFGNKVQTEMYEHMRDEKYWKAREK